MRMKQVVVVDVVVVDVVVVDVVVVDVVVVVVVVDVVVIVVVVVDVVDVVVRDFEPEGNQSSRKSQPTKMNHKNLKMILCNATKKTFCKKNSIPAFSIYATYAFKHQLDTKLDTVLSFNVHSLQCLEITCE